MRCPYVREGEVKFNILNRNLLRWGFAGVQICAVRAFRRHSFQPLPPPLEKYQPKNLPERGHPFPSSLRRLSSASSRYFTSGNMFLRLSLSLSETCNLLYIADKASCQIRMEFLERRYSQWLPVLTLFYLLKKSHFSPFFTQPAKQRKGTDTIEK